MKSYKYRNKIYSIKHCVAEDIPFHLERVLSYLQDDEIEPYTSRMNEAIQNSTAYKLVNENGDTEVFAYYEQKDNRQVHGISLWWNSIRLFAIFGIWFRYYTENIYVHINPHKNNLISFKFLVEDDSIRDYKLRGTSLCIDMFSIKCGHIEDILTKMKVEEI